MKSKPYAICLDNRKASFDEKLVNLAIDLSIDWENPSKQDLEAISMLRGRDGTKELAEADEAVQEISVS
ncbi:unnamed protein product [Protopolystoma xenopodis]|uniref:Uncharacterized protein n=1 Tax=Protopolystoma xenopodis TaxID=117903 RepID=A0A3S5AJ83_9PLAT|nr:unnamed protein product [Protopolystoma xenopodis]